MPERKDTSTFIEEARRVHGDRYDYSQVDYVSCRQRVKIICPVHGVFKQTPDLHRKGRNCRKCSSIKATEKQATFCRFCGKRVFGSCRHKQRCDSDFCKTQHEIEKNRTTGNAWIDVIRHKWSKEKQRQRNNALSGWERKCRSAYLSLWRRERYRKPHIKRAAKSITSWDELINKSFCKVRREAKEQSMSGWYKKIIRFCRESSQGRRNMSARKGYVNRNALFSKLKSQGYRCAMSGLPLTTDTAEIDHIQPVQQGGETTIDNLQWLHSEVNRMKGMMDNGKFIELCSMVVKQTLQIGTPPGA